jgi:hypothetical protein
LSDIFLPQASPGKNQKPLKSPTILGRFNIDGLLRNRKAGFSVFPERTGIQLFQDVLDPGSRLKTCRRKLRRADDPRDSLRDQQYYIKKPEEREK